MVLALRSPSSGDRTAHKHCTLNYATRYATNFPHTSFLNPQRQSPSNGSGAALNHRLDDSLRLVGLELFIALEVVVFGHPDIL